MPGNQDSHPRPTLQNHPNHQTKRHELTSITSGSKSSSLKERTLETWVPIDRWTPEHSMQIMIPKLIEHHSGASTQQSAHWPLPGIIASSSNT